MRHDLLILQQTAGTNEMQAVESRRDTTRCNRQPTLGPFLHLQDGLSTDCKHAYGSLIFLLLLNNVQLLFIARFDNEVRTIFMLMCVFLFQNKNLVSRIQLILKILMFDIFMLNSSSVINLSLYTQAQNLFFLFLLNEIITLTSLSLLIFLARDWKCHWRAIFQVFYLRRQKKNVV